MSIKTMPKLVTISAGLSMLAVGGMGTVAHAATPSASDSPSASATPSASSSASDVSTAVASAMGTNMPAQSTVAPSAPVTPSNVPTQSVTASATPAGRVAVRSLAKAAIPNSSNITSLSANISCTGTDVNGSCVATDVFALGRGKITINGYAEGAAAGTKLNILYVNASNGSSVVHGTAIVGSDGMFQWRESASSVGTISYSVETQDGKLKTPSMTIKTIPNPSNPVKPTQPPKPTQPAPPIMKGNVTATKTAYTVDTMNPSNGSAVLSTHLANQTADVQVLVGDSWRHHAYVKTNSSGVASFPFDYNEGVLGNVYYRVVINGVASQTMKVTMSGYSDFSTQGVTRSMVPNTYHSGCPVTPAMLTRVNMNYVGFDGRVHRGYIIFNSSWVKNLEAAFSVEMSTKFPIRQMHDPSVYGNDEVSMANDDTYAFYCRPVSGNPGVLSPHSYGRSVDVNTVENPYEEPSGAWKPSNGASYVNRRNVRPGMFEPNTAFTLAFENHYFKWLGAASQGSFDYQHFQIR